MSDHPIVDAHAHLGADQVFDVDFRAEDLVRAQEECGVEVTIVQPATAHDLPTAMRYHDAIAELARARPGRIFGMANPNPHLLGEVYEEEVRRCIDDLGFVGIKMHPTAHAVNPLGRDARRVYEAARRHRVPLMVHTGAGIPWAAPLLFERPCEEYPDVAFVIAHSGMMVLAGEAGELARKRDNVYLECTWTPGFQVRHWAERLGADRLLFGSDHADNTATELTKFRTAGLSPAELDLALGGTALLLYRLEGV